MQNPPQTDRIVHCADYGGPYSGSFVPMLVAAAKAARARGYETTICFSEVARDRPWLVELEGLADVRFIERSGLRENARQLDRVVDHGVAGATLLHTHFGTFDEATALLRLRHRRTRVLWHAHSGTTRRIRLRSKLYGAVFGRIIDGIVCVSGAMVDEMVARRFPPAKVRQLPNAIDIDRFPPITAEERAAARNALGVPQEATVVLHFAWNWAIKGGEALLATAKAISSNPEVMFLTVIGEHGGDAPRDEIERTPNVRPLAPSANVNELYAAADAFLNCSMAEGGLPYAVLEALARGLPAVVTVPPVRPEIVEGLPAGRAVAREPQAIAAALEEVLAFTPAQRAAHAEAARQRVATSYALEPWARQLVDLYDEALGATR
jgi:glycosyltransferase involved in cell wall biosynthesis